MGQNAALLAGPAIVRGREYAQIREPAIQIGAKEIPVRQAQARADIQAVVAKFTPEGWVLVGVYPADIGVQLCFERPVC